MKHILMILLSFSYAQADSSEIHLQKICECGRTVHLTLRQVQKKVVVRKKKKVAVRVRPKVCVVRRKVKVRAKTEAELATEVKASKGADE
jgi:hypothetical protein